MGLGGAQLSATNQYAYKTSYEAGMWGDVKKYALDLDTGVLPVDANGNPLNAPLWSAATQLDAQAAVSGAVNGWDTQPPDRDDQRRDATPRSRSASRTCRPRSRRRSTPDGAASPSPPTAQAVLNYLRGDKSNEGVNTTNFRTRSHILGDIVYSAAVPVGAPSAPYATPERRARPIPATTRSSRRKASRTPMVYVGANDGMLHAFDDTRGRTAARKPGRTFRRRCSAAAIRTIRRTRRRPPSSSGRSPSGAAASRCTRTSSTSTRRRASGTSISRNTNTTTPPTTGNDWRTILVGGLGAGGRAVYALDVTTPVAPPPPVVSADTEATAAAKVLWEFTDANLGYVYDAPTLVKTYAYGWVVLVASGYNNPGGKGFLYVLNPNAPLKAGQLLKKIPLPGDTGTDTSPTGLSHHPRLHRQPPESVRAAGLRRRPQGQRLALRPFQSRRDPVEGGADRHAEGREQQARSRSRPASASRSTRTTTSIAICSSAPASCSISRISPTRR